MQFSVKKIAVLGGGTAGWSAAALLAERYRKHQLDIVLIESPHISTVGVGEATVPAILAVHRNLKIDEREFVKATDATFKLGIEFRDWNYKGGRFFHPFSDFGVKVNQVDFHQCWAKLQTEGIDKNIEEYSLCASLAKAGRFALPDNDSENPLVWYGYAYHFDAALYARFLRAYSEERGVKRISDTVVSVEKNKDTDFIQKLRLESGQEVEADLFIDCSGFRSILLEGQYQVGYDDWSHWLPCDRAVAAQTESDNILLPYTTSTAMRAGWQWRIPLQKRTGNGYVYSSNYVSDDEACADFIKTLGEPLITDPRVIQFKAGMRPEFWVKNCVAVGLSSGFIEPLESTSISLMQTGVGKIISQLPDSLIITEDGIARANELNKLEYQNIRDFIILHYWANKRDDSSFWKEVRNVALPSTLQDKLDAFRENAKIILYAEESFKVPSWVAMYNGFKIIPKSVPVADNLATDQLTTIFDRINNAIKRGVEHAPLQADFLKTVYE